MKIPFSQVTPQHVYLSRRRFLAAGFAAPFVALSANKITGYSKSPLSTTEQATPYQAVTTYNNFYEFGTSKDEPAKLARNFRTSPWTVTPASSPQRIAEVLDGIGVPFAWDRERLRTSAYRTVRRARRRLFGARTATC